MPTPDIILGGVHINLLRGALSWTSGLAVDADGSPRAYAPAGSRLPALDYLANAGKPEHWWGLACTGSGSPFVQQPGDPYPGYYVSTTALIDSRYAVKDPRRYVDSEKVPYLAIPPELFKLGCKKGDIAWVRYKSRACGAIVGDVGPRGHVGEGSIALATALGIPSSPKNGGISSSVSVTLFLGSAAREKIWPDLLSDLDKRAKALWSGWSLVV